MILIQPINFHSTLYYIILSWVLRFPLPVYHYKHNLIINSNPHYLNHTDTDINHKTCIQKKKSIQILTFGQQKNARYKKQQS
jgi:hypothetical protein